MMKHSLTESLFPPLSSSKRKAEPIPFHPSSDARALTSSLLRQIPDPDCINFLFSKKWHFRLFLRFILRKDRPRRLQPRQSPTHEVTAVCPDNSYGTLIMASHQQETYSNYPEVVQESNLESISYGLAESGPQKEQYTVSGQQHDRQHGGPAWTADTKDAPNTGNGKTRLILIGSAFLIAIISGVIGGIVGWQVTEKRLNSSSANTGADVSPTSTDTDSDTSSSSSSAGSGRTCATNGTLTSASVVRNGTALAATGWRYGDEHVIWLYFQGSDDTLQYLVYDTMYGEWAGPTMLSLESGAVSGTALTATTLLWARSTGAPPEPQPQLVYQDTSGTLKGVAWYVFP